MSGFLGQGKARLPGEKSQSRDKNQQQTQPTYGADFGTRA